MMETSKQHVAGRYRILHEQRKVDPNPGTGKVGESLSHVSRVLKDKVQELAKKRTELHWLFEAEKTTQAKAWGWKIAWLIWRMTTGPVL